MKSILLCVGLLVSSWITHDVAVAVFTFSETAGKLKLTIVIDRADLCQELSIEESYLKVESVQEYLDTYFQIFINKTFVNVNVSQIEHDEDHIIVQADLGSSIRKYNKIVVNNSCLNSITNHSNIMRFKLHGTQRDFRMHDGRKRIEVSY